MKRNLRKSVIAGLGTATATAALFAGAGSAQAFTWVTTNTDALGVTVHVMSFGGPASSGWCTYTAIPSGPGIPVYNVPFYLQENGTHDLWFPGIQTGTTWDVDVACENGVNSATQHVVY